MTTLASRKKRALTVKNKQATKQDFSVAVPFYNYEIFAVSVEFSMYIV